MADTILEMRNITKEFPGVKALNGVDLSIARGEIHALVGENGAGKSTLMNVLSGVYPYGTYAGAIVFEGKVHSFKAIHDSERVGIVIIHQELALIPYLSIGENIFLRNERAKNQVIDWDMTFREASRLLELVGLAEDPRTPVMDISVRKQQLVEIAKALSKSVKVLVLDEPTASLNEKASEHLLALLRELKAKGLTSILISHKLSEVTEVADSITILRDGSTIETLEKGRDEISEGRIIKGMVGREIVDRFPRRAHAIGDVAFEVRGWNVYSPINPERRVIKDVSLRVRKGEVVGIAGLMGAGRTELAMSLFGRSYGVRASGEVYKDGARVDLGTPRRAMNIKTPSILQKVGNLSGGNQQKVVLSKWIFADPDVLILDEPTRGIDVGAKYEIYTIINALADQGKAVIFISSESSLAKRRPRRASCGASCRPAGRTRMKVAKGLFHINVRQYAMLIALVAIMAFFQVATGGVLLVPMNVTNLVLQNAYVFILAIGMTLCLVTGGNIDMSVGSLVAFVGAICGTLIVTLAGMLSLRGLAINILEGQTVGPFPESYQLISAGFDVPSAPVFAAQVAAYSFFMGRTVPGRYIYAMGGNEKAAKLSGIDTNKVLFFSYVNMGVLTAVAGVVFSARLNAAAPGAGDTFALDAIAACFIGGASAYGGIGTIVGSIIGALVMGVLNNGMSIMGVGSDIQQVVKGRVLLADVGLGPPRGLALYRRTRV